MVKVKREGVGPIIKAIALWIVLTASFCVISAAVTTTVKDPLNTTSASAKISVILSSFISGIIVRLYGVTTLHALILSAFAGITVFCISCIDGLTATGIVMTFAEFGACFIGYFITNIMRASRKNRRRRR